MSESQRQRQFSVQRASSKGPLHLLHTRRVSQLQGKANFFEGQIDPLHQENVNLKEQLQNLNKVVAASTDTLRCLLPQHQDPTRRLKLQMASLLEVASMISEDWKQMEQRIQSDGDKITKLTSESYEWRCKYEREVWQRAREVGGLKQQRQTMEADYQERLSLLNSEIALLKSEHLSEKQRMKEEFASRTASFQASLREYELFKRETRNKQEEMEKCIQRLRGEIEANLISFEEGKKNLRGIYDKLMADKLLQQAEGFQLMLRLKQEQKNALILQMVEAEQDYKRRAAQKDSEIAKLNEHVDRHLRELSTLKDDNWQKQREIDEAKQFRQTLEEQLYKLEEEKKVLIQQLQQKGEDMEEQRQRLEATIRQRERDIQMLQAEGSSSIAKLMQEKTDLQAELAEKQAKLRQTLIALRKSEDEWAGKMDVMRNELLKQEEQIRKALEAEQKKLREKSDLLQKVEAQREEMRARFKREMQELQQQRAAERLKMRKQMQDRLQEQQQARRRQIQQLKYAHQRALTEATIAANEQLRQLMANCNRKISQHEQQLAAQMERMLQKAMLAQQALRAQEEKAQRERQANRLAMQQMEAEREAERAKMNRELEQQLKEFMKSLEEKEAQLNQLKADMQNEIKLLKDAQGIDAIEQRFQAQIDRLKAEFAEKRKQQQEEHQLQVKLLVDSHETKQQELKDDHQNSLKRIAENVSNESTYLNERLLNGFQSAQWQGMSSQERQTVILDRIEQMKTSVTKKDHRIAEMEYELEQAERNVERRVKARKEELERQKELLARECTAKMDALSSECRAKVTAAERERLHHTQIMYKEFTTLRLQFQEEMANLQRKYTELERLFEERPSRAEDLSKIKELINLQTKLDIEIQTYQKKMETANEIVKYLNLELQNYKDAYDIFAPNQDSSNIGIVGRSTNQHPSSATRSPSHPNDSQQLIDVLRAQKQESELRPIEQYRSQSKEQLSFRRWNDSPAIKDLKLFQEKQYDESIAEEPIENTQPRRYSNLVPEKGRRFKTQHKEKVDSEAEIIINAQNFIRLIQGSREEQSVIREVNNQQYGRRKSYRKRRLHKRNPTTGIQHYF